MADKISKRSFTGYAGIADAWCIYVAVVWHIGNGCRHYLYQQYGTGYESGHVVF